MKAHSLIVAVVVFTVGISQACPERCTIPSHFRLSSPSSGSTYQSSDTITLSWNKPTSNVTGYRVYIGTSNPPTTHFHPISSPTTTSFNVPTDHKQASTTYYWRVQAVNACGGGKLTNTNYATLPGDITVDTRYYNISAPADTTPPIPNPATFSSVPNAISSTEITMTATTGSDPCGPVDYNFVETSGNPGGSNSGWISDNFYTDSGLDPSTEYTYTVQMRDSLLNTGAASDPCSDTTAPASPSNVTTLALNTSRIDLSWTDNSGSNEDGFKIQCSIGGGGWNDVNTVASDVNSYSHTYLTSDLVYTYQVCSYHNTDGDSEWSSSSPDSPFPFEPNGLSATADDSSAILNWNVSTENDWDSYKIYRGTLPGGPYNVIKAGHDSNSYTDNSANNGKFYYYVVTTFDTSGHESVYSNEDSVFPRDSNAPAKPLGLDATGGDAFVSLVWNDNNEPDLAGYNVYRSMVSGGPYSQIAGGIEPNSYTNNGLGKGKTYYYVVKAVDTSLNLSMASDAASAIPLDDDDPDAPRNLMASAGEASVTLYWTASKAPDVNGYNIYRCQSQGFDPNVSNQVASIVKGVSFEDSPVVDDVALYYKARAEDTSGNKSLPSNEVMAIAHTPAPPNAPSGLSAVAISSIQINLSWADSNDSESGFRIERKMAGGFFR